jgi:hypothetical protein
LISRACRPASTKVAACRLGLLFNLRGALGARQVRFSDRPLCPCKLRPPTLSLGGEKIGPDRSERLRQSGCKWPLPKWMQRGLQVSLEDRTLLNASEVPRPNLDRGARGSIEE